MRQTAGTCVWSGGSRGDKSTDRRVLLAIATTCVALLALVACAHASAKEVLKFKEAFGGAAQPVLESPAGLAVDQSTGDLLVMDRGNATISRFKPDGTPDEFSALGTNIISELPGGAPLSFAGANESQIAVDNSGTATDGDIYVTHSSPASVDIFAGSGQYLGSLTGTSTTSAFREVCGVSVGPNGSVFVGDYVLGISKFVPSSNPVAPGDFESTVPGSSGYCTNAAGAGSLTGTLFAAAYNSTLRRLNLATGDREFDVSQGNATTSAIEVRTGDVLVAEEDNVAEYDASGQSSATKVASATVGSTVQGVAAGPSGLVYVSRVGATGIEVYEHAPLPVVSALPPTVVAPTSVTLEGTIDPREAPVTRCDFEVENPTSPGPITSVPCEPSTGSLPVDRTSQISAVVAGLEPNATYRFRIVAANANGVETSLTTTFRTAGPPEVLETRAIDADQSSVTLEAVVDPRGFDSTYRIEWGTDGNYGQTAAAGLVRAVEGPTRVSARVSGLSIGTQYHYRVVISSEQGAATSGDQLAETTNSCGLPEARCFELVAPNEPVPVGQAGEVNNLEPGFQAALSGPGALAFEVQDGFPDATKGGEVEYLAHREPSRWSYSQMAPPISARNESSGTASGTSKILAISPDLACHVVETNQPLTEDPAMKLAVESGGFNLYLQNADGSYTAISNLAPENPQVGSVEDVVGGGDYVVVGMTADCQKVLFTSVYHYPGVGGVGNSRLYEWDDGTLRIAGLIPGPGGVETGADVVPGDTGTLYGNYGRVFSADGTRAFFTAKRLISANSAEIGNPAVFVRDNGRATRDVSQSETNVPDQEAVYQYASVDGARVFFTANAGLTDESSAGGTDLYEYDLSRYPSEHPLTDLSVKSGGTAEVSRMIGASDDGRVIYFAARGQLVVGQGRSSKENLEANTYSIYMRADGVTEYVGAFAGKEELAVTLRSSLQSTSEVSPDGRFLVFESGVANTSYQSDGAQEAYLFDRAENAHRLTCISCRRDGLAPLTSGRGPLDLGTRANLLHKPNLLAEHNGTVSVFFRSLDRLAQSAPDGLFSVYEWTHGQVFKIASEPPGLQPLGRPNPSPSIYLGDSNSDGSDFFFASPEVLAGRNDGRLSVYDARIGGGFLEVTAPGASCDPNVEGSCQPPASPGVETPSAGSKSFMGPSNGKQKKHHRRKHHRRRHKGHQSKARHGKRHHGKTPRAKTKGARHHKGNRGAGK